MKNFKIFSKWGGKGLDFLFPPLCVACSQPVTQGDSLCVDCFKQLEPIVQPSCDLCGTPFVSRLEASTLCVPCLHSRPSWQQGRAGLVYNDLARELILSLKYSGNEKPVPILVKFMLSASLDIIKSTDIVVPVPLHLRKLRQRGYNQAVLLGKAFSKAANLDFFPDLLMRHSDTASLGKASAVERRRILGNAIAVRPKYAGHSFAGRRIILIDDVMTSGATAEICAKALSSLKCSAIMVVVALRGRMKDSP